MQTILFGTGLALILIFSLALTVAVVSVILWAAFRSQSPRTGTRNRRFPSTDTTGAIIPGATMYDTTNPSPDLGTPHHSHDTGSGGHHHGHGHHDAGSFGSHSHSGGFDGGGGHSHGGGFDGGGGGGHGH